MPLAYIHFIHEGQHPVDPGWSAGIGGGGQQPPLGIWGGPWQPPHASQGPGFPTHPIAPGGGGQPPHPSQGPGFPTQPIYLPKPPGAGGGQPPQAAQLPVFPPEATHPIQLPPDVAPPEADGKKIEWKAAWSQMTGWVVVGIPQGETPTPSGQPQPSTPQRRG